MQRAVFLDRDGVLNQTIVRDGKPFSPRSLAEFKLSPGIEGLNRLKERGFLLVVVTNQPNVPRGIQTQDEVEEFHQILRAQVPVDAVRVCYHDDAENCLCRKPKPGLLIKAALEYDIDLSCSYMVGDTWRDIDAGAAAGCRTIWIDHGYRDREPSFTPHVRVATLIEAINWIERDNSQADLV